MGKRAIWELVPGPLPPGVQCRHRTWIGGWVLESELVLTGTGLAEVRINGALQGGPIPGSLSAARRTYRAIQRKVRLQQSLLPL